MSGVAPGKPVEYHVLKHGEMFGPFSEEELRAGLTDGRFEARDFVQVEGYVVWRPLGKVLESIGQGAEQEMKGAVAPDWPTILKWAWLRLRFDLDEQAATAGAVCLVLGCLALTLSHWPFVFWAPWLVGALFAAIGLFRHKREAHGALLLAGIILLPSLLYFFGPKSKASAPGAVPASAIAEKVEASPAETTAKTAPAWPSGASLAATPAPAPSVLSEALAPLRGAPPLPSAPTPAALAPAHAAPVVTATPATPLPAATPAPPSLVAQAGKLAESVGPLIAGAKAALPSQLPSLPSLPKLPSIPFLSSSSESAASTESPANTAAAESTFIQNHMDAFVIIKGSNGAGSGFAARVGDETYLFSNIHVVSEVKQPQITRLDGTSISVGSGEVAAGPDIARLTMAVAPPHPLEVTNSFDSDVHIDDEVVVLGNSGGGGVVTSLKGKVLGIGPDRLEVSAQFIPGNSGSPIIHVKTGKVIGIATYLIRRYEEFAPNSSNDKSASNVGTGAVVVRRFGYRLDKVPAWEPANWPELYREADQIERISKLTEDIFNFLDALRNGTPPNFATDALRRPATDWFEKIRAQHVSDTDRLSATQGMLSALRLMVKGDVAAASNTLRYTYFRNRLQDEKQVRDRLYKAFDSKLSQMSSPLSRHH